ncbi:hypothetical protein [Streptomyces sp. NRRL S-1868]|uniref:hypothetical protein n=1 Tax=Streptomyces sp. NRRL S-1868 TaxID=1463892 RepID=UPI000AFF8633|nr:hypothetical protein [Streptomyces sp. NRRL S-1868]
MVQILTRPAAAVTAAPDEPEPQHDRSTSSPNARPHATSVDESTLSEALRRVVERQIGPRQPGVVYQAPQGGTFRVLGVTRNPDYASALVERRHCQWAVIVQDVNRPNAASVPTNDPWTPQHKLLPPRRNTPGEAA